MSASSEGGRSATDIGSGKSGPHDRQRFMRTAGHPARVYITYDLAIDAVIAVYRA